MPNIVRIGDMTTGHGCFFPQPILTGSPTVKANGISINRIGDQIMPHCCLSGDTKILLSDNTTIKISELIDNYQDKKVISILGNKLVVADITNAFKTKYVKSLIELKFENYSIKCTRDHEIRLIDGSYKEAQYITELDELTNIYESECHIISNEIIEYDNHIMVYDLTINEVTPNFTLDNGLIISNCGIVCHPSNTATGSSTVKANGIPIARIGDMANCGSILATGSPNVIINDAPQPPKSVSVKPSQYDDAAVAQLSLEAGQYAAYDEEETIGDLPSSQYTDSDGNMRDNPVSDEGSLGRESGNSAVSNLKANQKDALKTLIIAMNEAGIKDHKEQAMFLAQCDHESAGFTKLREGVYSPDNVWKQRGETLASFGITLDKLKADAIAKTRQYMYEYMYQDNYRTIKFKTGNDQLGDGIKYIGRGYLQLTGKPNYKAMGKKFGLDLLNHPELVETPDVAAKTAIEYWFKTKCRTPAQRGDVPAVTQIINGGQNGLPDRTKKYHDYLTDANLGRFDLPYKEIPASATPTKTVVVDKNGLSTDMNLKLSPHFTLGDFSTKCIFPHKVKAQGEFTENDIVYNLKTLANNPMETIWAKYPNFRINSGFRTYTKGVSQHEKGQACDIQWPNISNAEYLERAKWIRTNVTYDQLLFEHGNSIWIHVSFDPNKSRQRMDCKTMYKGKFTTGLTLYYN